MEVEMGLSYRKERTRQRLYEIAADVSAEAERHEGNVRSLLKQAAFNIEVAARQVQ